MLKACFKLRLFLMVKPALKRLCASLTHAKGVPSPLKSDAKRSWPSKSVCDMLTVRWQPGVRDNPADGSANLYGCHLTYNSTEEDCARIDISLFSGAWRVRAILGGASVLLKYLMFKDFASKTTFVMRLIQIHHHCDWLSLCKRSFVKRM